MEVGKGTTQQTSDKCTLLMHTVITHHLKCGYIYIYIYIFINYEYLSTLISTIYEYMFTLGDACTPYCVQQYLPLNIRVKLHFYLFILLLLL